MNTERNPYAAPEARVEAPPEQSLDRYGPEGLGGWLVLVGIQMVASPLLLMYQMSQIYPPAFKSDVWNALTNPASPAYHPGWGPFVVCELIVNIGMLIAAMVAIALYFSKSPRFPRLYIGLVVATIVALVADLIGGRIIVPEAPVDPSAIKEIVRACVSAAIWVPYMLVSVRVKNTFVRRD